MNMKLDCECRKRLLFPGLYKYLRYLDLCLYNLHCCSRQNQCRSLKGRYLNMSESDGFGLLKCRKMLQLQGLDIDTFYEFDLYLFLNRKVGQQDHLCRSLNLESKLFWYLCMSFELFQDLYKHLLLKRYYHYSLN